MAELFGHRYKKWKNSLDEKKMADHNGIKIRSRIKHDKLLKKLYKKSAKHWFWQILRWRFTRNYTLRDCAFCKEAYTIKTLEDVCVECLIDKSICDKSGTRGMIKSVSYKSGKERIKPAKLLRKELKKRAK